MARDPDPAVGNDAQLLEEMLRESERILDHQLRAIEELDDKSEHMLTVSVAVLGGGAALATIAAQASRASVDGTFLAILGTAGALNLASLAMFLESYIGFRIHTEVHVGPSVEWVASKVNDASWSLLHHYVSVIKDIPSYYRWNDDKQAASAKKRRRGTHALVAAVALYGIAFLYIVARAIGGPA